MVSGSEARRACNLPLMVVLQRRDARLEQGWLHRFGWVDRLGVWAPRRRCMIFCGIARLAGNGGSQRVGPRCQQIGFVILW